MIIKVSEETKIMAWEFLQKNNIGNRSVGNGNMIEQFVGLIGEIEVKKLFGKPIDLIAGFDGGFDFELNGKRIDVKTMGRNVDVKDDYVNNFIGYQKHFDCDIYIFCSLNKKKNELTICGWVTKKELFEMSEMYEEGTERKRSDGTSFLTKAPLYEIKNNQLNNINKLL